MSNQSNQGQSNNKRGAKKRLRESGSQTEENIIPNGGHCCEAAPNLAEMNSKLDKVLSLFTEMEWLNWKKITRNWKKQWFPQMLKFENLKCTTVYSSITVDKVTKELSSLEEEVLKLKSRNIKLEAYTRRENLKLFNIEEKEDENVDTEEINENDVLFSNDTGILGKRNSQQESKLRPSDY